MSVQSRIRKIEKEKGNVQKKKRRYYKMQTQKERKGTEY